MWHEVAHRLAVGTEGADECGHGDHAGFHHQLGSLADAADVLAPIVLAETKVGTEAVADIVAIEHESATAALVELFLHGMGQCRLASTGETGEPEHTGFMSVELFAAGAGDGGVMPDDVVGGGLGHGL